MKYGDSDALRPSAVNGTALLGPVEADTALVLNVALRGGARFVEGRKPVEIVRSAYRSSIFAIQNDPRGRGELVQRFLRHGPLRQMEKQVLEAAAKCSGPRIWMRSQ